jgi:hypothetical protein
VSLPGKLRPIPNFLGSEAGDGTVTLSSQAQLAAQEEGQTIRALGCRHMDILHRPEIGQRVGQLLARRFFD